MRFDDVRLPSKLAKIRRGKSGHADDGGTVKILNACSKGVCDMKKTLKVNGMSCMHCVARVEKALAAVDGVTDVTVSMEKGEAVVGGNFDVAAAVKAVTDAGYDCAE